MKAYCTLCGRQLTHPTSIRRGMGHTCYSRYVNNLKRLEAQEKSGENNENIYDQLQGKGDEKKANSDRNATN